MERAERVRGSGAGLAVIVPLAIALNLAVAVVCKYLAMSLGRLALAVMLLAAFGAVYALRTVYWVWVGKKWQLSFLYPVLSVSYLFSFFLGRLVVWRIVSRNASGRRGRDAGAAEPEDGVSSAGKTTDG